MFGEVAETLISKEISDAVQVEVGKLKDTDMTEKSWKVSLKLLLAAAQAADPTKIARPKRTVLIPYRGIEVFVKVGSMLAECELNLSSLAKERAIYDGKLCLLQFESELISGKPPPRLKTCEPLMLSRAEVARGNMNTCLQAFESSGTATIRSVIDTKFKKILSTDPFFLPSTQHSLEVCPERPES